MATSSESTWLRNEQSNEVPQNRVSNEVSIRFDRSSNATRSATIANGEPNVVWKPADGTTSVSLDRNVVHKLSTLYLYFDESGNIDYGDKGSSHLIITCVVTQRPFTLANQVQDFHMDLMENGIDIERFHACEDNRDVRLGLYKLIESSGDEIRAYSVYVDKRRIPKSRSKESDVYAELFELLVKEVFKSEHLDDLELVVAITDRLPVAKKRSRLIKPLKRCMKHQFQNRGITYRLYHHSSCSDMNLQIADYFCWAVYRSVVKGLSWPMDLVRGMMVEVGEVEYQESVDTSVEEPAALADPSTSTFPPIP